jgi:beta-RFAP synthase
MVDTPSLTVEVSDHPAEQGTSSGDAAALTRANKFLADFQRSALADRTSSDLTVTRLQPLPSHQGLGSGTQLALAVGAAAAQLVDGTRWSATDLAPHLGRGARSAVGLYGFDLGGLIVDAGKHAGDLIGQLAARVAVPADWRFVLLTPTRGEIVAGDTESAAFQKLPPYPTALPNYLSRLILTETLPSAISGDFNRFADALSEYGRRVGEAFHEAQGGVVHRSARALWDALSKAGLSGVAQSSWGPSLAVAQRSEESARAFVEQLRKEEGLFSLQPLSWNAVIAAPRNLGAEIRVAG